MLVYSATYSAAIVNWTVPTTANYLITASGAQGASQNGFNAGAKGATMSGVFALIAGQVLKILVGNADVRKTLDEAQSLALKRIERQ